MPWGDFKLAELNLDLQNIRTGNQDDQRAALRALIADQGQKLVNLAIDILKMGKLSPGEPLWVTADTDNKGKQIVLEGNRRVASLKLMENPRLADETEVSVAFTRLAKDFANNPIRSVEAQVFASRDEAWPWIERRHMGAASGVGLQHWRSLAKERARVGVKGAVRRSLLVLDYLDDDTDEFGEVGAVIEAKSTTVDRVLNNPAMKDVLGVTIDRANQSITFDNGDEIAGRRLLRDLVSEMAKPEFKFSRVRDEGDRVSFIQEFSDRSVRREGSGTSEAAGDSAAAPAKAKRGPRLSDPPRPTLAPKNGARTFRVDGDRLQRLYKECRNIKLADNENAAALLLRVFIELSSEAFLTEKSIPLPPKTAARGVTDWGEMGVFLRDKIFAVLAVIDTSGRDRKLQKVRVALNPTSQADGSITTLHGYFHNLHMTPGVAMVREAWDTWEPYLRLLHAARI